MGSHAGFPNAPVRRGPASFPGRVRRRKLIAWLPRCKWCWEVWSLGGRVWWPPSKMASPAARPPRSPLSHAESRLASVTTGIV